MASEIVSVLQDPEGHSLWDLTWYKAQGISGNLTPDLLAETGLAAAPVLAAHPAGAAAAASGQTTLPCLAGSNGATCSDWLRPKPVDCLSCVALQKHADSNIDAPGTLVANPKTVACHLLSDWACLMDAHVVPTWFLEAAQQDWNCRWGGGNRWY
jgi:hypothetical protein